MDDEQTWSIYFAGICSMQFHPRNQTQGVTPDTLVTWAAKIADAMLQEHHDRWPVEKGETCPG